jgi:hypothetical protein
MIDFGDREQLQDEEGKEYGDSEPKILEINLNSPQSLPSSVKLRGLDGGKNEKMKSDKEKTL